MGRTGVVVQKTHVCESSAIKHLLDRTPECTAVLLITPIPYTDVKRYCNIFHY